MDIVKKTDRLDISLFAVLTVKLDKETKHIIHKLSIEHFENKAKYEIGKYPFEMTKTFDTGNDVLSGHIADCILDTPTLVSYIRSAKSFSIELPSNETEKPSRGQQDFSYALNFFLSAYYIDVDKAFAKAAIQYNNESAKVWGLDLTRVVNVLREVVKCGDYQGVIWYDYQGKGRILERSFVYVDMYT